MSNANDTIKFYEVETSDGDIIEVVRADDSIGIAAIITEAGDREMIQLYTRDALEKEGRSRARKSWRKRHEGTLAAVEAELEARYQARLKAMKGE